MSIGILILLLVLVGAILGLVPMDSTLRNIVVAVVGLFALVFVLRYAGLL